MAETAAAGSGVASKPVPGDAQMPKLPPIPKGSKIHKRPLTRPQLPASSKTPVIYVSSRTPFISAVKRVRKHLDRSIRSSSSSSRKAASLQSRIAALQRDAAAGNDSSGGGVVVTLVGTGKAVERTLALAACFEQKGDCDVRVTTKTVGAVDDVVPARDGQLGDGEDDGEANDSDDGLGAEGESRVRKLSCLQVQISLK